MYFKQILNERYGCASYIVASRSSQEAAVIDPALDIEPYITLLEERGFRLRYVIDTHVHADHISGARKLAEQTGATLCLYESAEVNYPFRKLSDGEDIALGQIRLHMMHTPGHRAELVSIAIANLDRGLDPEIVLTGDSLLVGDVGRPDFGGGDPEEQYESVHRLLAMPDWVAVFPGHFEGPCGQNMEGRPVTTVGFERRTNALAQLDRDAFVAALMGDIPERPLNMLAIEATNRGYSDMSWAMLTSAQSVESIPVTELPALESGMLLIDVREPGEYENGHVPGAINMPQAELATRLEDLPRDSAIYAICGSGARSLRAAGFLRQQGYEHVVNLAGGTRGWISAGRPVVTGAAVNAPGTTQAD